MMRYLMKNTQRFFEDTTGDGKEIWKRVRDNIIIILATPNGWDIREQAILRKAAIKASLFTEENSKQLLEFVTESEASVHYALANQQEKWLKKNIKFVVMDCGGSTVDTTVYRSLSISPLMLQEVCPSECIQVFRLILSSHLCGYGNRTDISMRQEAFSSTAKLRGCWKKNSKGRRHSANPALSKTLPMPLRAR